jgi:hypothetical protein
MRSFGEAGLELTGAKSIRPPFQLNLQDEVAKGKGSRSRLVDTLSILNDSTRTYQGPRSQQGAEGHVCHAELVSLELKSLEQPWNT